MIAALVEGTSINATCRMTGVAKHTVLKLLKEMGCAAAAYHNAHVRNLRVRRVQADEIWAFVYGKDKNLTMEQVQAGAGSIGREVQSIEDSIGRLSGTLHSDFVTEKSDAISRVGTVKNSTNQEVER